MFSHARRQLYRKHLEVYVHDHEIVLFVDSYKLPRYDSVGFLSSVQCGGDLLSKSVGCLKRSVGDLVAANESW